MKFNKQSQQTLEVEEDELRKQKTEENPTTEKENNSKNQLKPKDKNDNIFHINTVEKR